MFPHSINLQNNFIAGWYMEDTSICDEIIEYFKFCKDKTQGHIYFRDKHVVNKQLKDSLDTNVWDAGLEKRYFAWLDKCAQSYIGRYPLCNEGAPWHTLTAPNIQYYAPGGGYFAWHTERNMAVEPSVSRHLVYMTYLNDVTDGGETEFYYQQIKMRPEKGLTLLWPVDWTHTHRGVVSPTQDKYIVTGWFNYIERKA